METGDENICREQRTKGRNVQNARLSCKDVDRFAISRLFYLFLFTQPSYRKLFIEHNKNKYNNLDIVKLKFGFIKRVDKGEITTVKDLESWRFER